MGKYADMLGVAPQQPTTEAGGGKYASMLGLSAAPAKAENPDVGYIEGFARHAAQGASLGFADEFEAALRALGPATYDESIGKVRARNDAAPTSTKIAGTIAGALVVPGAGLGGLVARGATTGARLARGAGIGAMEGAIAGFGADEGGVADRLDGAAIGAALGAPFGAVGGAMARQADDVVDSAIPLTRGQRTGNYKQLAKEETLRKTGSKPLQEFDEVQRSAVAQQVDEIMPGGGSVADEAVRASDELGAVRDVMKGNERAAYQAFEESEGFLRKEAVEDLHHRLVGVMDDPTKGRALDPNVRKQSAGTLDEIRSLMTPQEGVEHITVQQIEGVRKAINQSINGADGSYKSAMIAVKREYDDWMENAIGSALYAGDAAALDKLKKARGIASDFRKIFDQGKGDVAGKMINKLIGDDASPEEAINMLFGMRKLGKAGTAQALRRIEKVSPESMDHLRAAGWARMMRDRKGELKSSQMIINSIDEALNETPELMRSLYGSATVAKMKKLSKELKRTITPRGAQNPSGTSYRLSEMVRGIAGPWGAAIGFASGADTAGMGALLLGGGSRAKDFLTAKAAVRAARKANRKPAIAATTGVPALTSAVVPATASGAPAQ